MFGLIGSEPPNNEWVGTGISWLRWSIAGTRGNNGFT